MKIPEKVTKLAESHGFNSVELVKRAPDESIYSVGCLDKGGVILPTGLPHYIVDRNGLLSFVSDDDFHITDAL